MNEYKYYKEVYEALESYREELQVKESGFIRVYQNAVNRFFKKYMNQEQTKDMQINHITFHDVNKHLEILRECSKPDTVLNHYRGLKSFFDYLRRVGLTTNDIFLRNTEKDFIINKNKVVGTKYLKASDLKKTLKYIEDNSADIKERLVLMLILYIGFSTGELINLKRSDIDIEYKKVYVTKNQRETALREKVLPDNVNMVLNEYIKKYERKLHEPLLGFNNQTATKSYIDKLTCKIFGYKCSPTKIRNTFRYNIISKNVKSLYLVSLILNETVGQTYKFAEEYKIIDNDEAFEMSRELLNKFKY